MLRPYDLLENILIDVEKGIRKGISVDNLAEKYKLSYRHLQRVFKFAFKQSLAGYIRSRRLAASLDDLLKTDMNILDIALDYGFCYEQSYIPSFKREFGITPGDLRKSGHILKVKPPLHLFNENKLADGLIFGPDIVMVPQFHVIGKKHKVAHRDAVVLPQALAKQFHSDDRSNIPNVINPDVLLNICSRADADAEYFYFMPSVQMKTPDFVPKGYDGFTFPTSLCARFRFINKHSEELNMHTADDMFHAIDNFMDSSDQKYFLERKRINIDKFDSSDNTEYYRQWEWFAPVIEKTTMKIAPFSPSGIKNIYKQKLPALRFIGKKYNEPPCPKNVLYLLDNCQINGLFNDIEKQSSIDYKTFYEGADAYISLVRKKDELFEHWMGMFLPKGTECPQGYEALDFPKMTIAVCRAYGTRDEVVNFEKEAEKKLKEEGFTPDNSGIYFWRFNWRGFYNEDIYGKCLLDYCYLV